MTSSASGIEREYRLLAKGLDQFAEPLPMTYDKLQLDGCKLSKCACAIYLLTSTAAIVLLVWDLGFLLSVPVSVPVCLQSNNSRPHTSIKLYVGVLSSAANYEKRMAVRRTWGSDAGLQRVVFVVANPANNATLSSLRREAVRYKDLIIIGHVMEHYFNITHQTLEVFRSAYAYQDSITHVMKCDDDSYIHVAELLSLLASHPRNNTLFGYVNSEFIPNRAPGGKWFVSREEWPDDRSNLQWTNGPGYVLTRDLADEVAIGAAYKCSGQKLFKLEDIALASWLRCLQNTEQVEIQAVHNPHFNLAGCAKGDIVSHYMTPKQMDCMFASGGACC